MADRQGSSAGRDGGRPSGRGRPAAAGRPAGGGGTRAAGGHPSAARSERPSGGDRPARPASAERSGRAATGGREARPISGERAGRPASGGREARPAARGERQPSGERTGRPGERTGRAGERTGRPGERSGRPAGARGERPAGGDRSARPATADRAARPPAARGDRPTQGGRTDGPQRSGPVRPSDRNLGGVRPTVRRPRVDEPAIDADIDVRGLDPEIKRELSTLAPAVAERAAGHLLMTARLIDDEPERAYAHAQVVRRLAGRLAISRETLGIAAYRTGRWAEALSELRAARRMTGAPDYLPMLADCERGLGRPERAVAALGEPDAARLDRAGKIELKIVAAGARRDMGQAPAAVAALQGRDLDDDNVADWTARLRYAYADALLDAGRVDDAITWFRRAAEADAEGQTDAEERLVELGAAEETDHEVLGWDEQDGDGVVVLDLEDDSAQP